MIARDEVEHIARLARLSFDEGEYERLARELSKILDYVQTLGELELEGVAPTAHAVVVRNVFRPDEPRACLTQEEAVANGPEVERGQFVVPRIG